MHMSDKSVEIKKLTNSGFQTEHKPIYYGLGIDEIIFTLPPLDYLIGDKDD